MITSDHFPQDRELGGQSKIPRPKTLVTRIRLSVTKAKTPTKQTKVMRIRKKGIMKTADDPLLSDRVTEIQQTLKEGVEPSPHTINNQERNKNIPPLTLDQGTSIQTLNTDEHQFIKRARLTPFDPTTFLPCQKPESFNNDLNTGSFTPSKYTWG